MALEKADILNIVQRYRDDATETTVTELSAHYKVPESTVIWHLKRAGTYSAKGSQVEFETDEELGINQDDAPTLDIAALIANPQFAALIDAAVAAHSANNGSVAAQSADFTALTATLQRMFEVQTQQQPGYIKPLSVEEVDRRADGYVEMKALLRRFEAERRAPMYLLTEMFFECTNAIQYEAGKQIRTFLPPAESFVPQNTEAEQVYAAMFQWIGGKTPHIGDQVEEAQRNSHLPPLVTGAMNPIRGQSSLVEAVDAPLKDVSRKRVAGTIVPERRDVGMTERLSGVTAVGDFAA